MSAVISRGPSLVSRATQVSSSMWMVKRSSAPPLGDQDRVLEVVAVPRHERDQQVLAERQLAQVGRRAVGQHVATRDRVAVFTSGRWLMQVFWFERVLGQVVDVDARLAGRGLGVVHPHHDARGVDRVDHAAAARDDRHARVDRHRPLHAGADQGSPARSVGTAWRCMFEPISARLASSCSRNGISEAATDTICFGETSM